MTQDIDVTKFKTCDQLELSSPEYNALIQVMHHLYDKPAEETRQGEAVTEQSAQFSHHIKGEEEVTLGFCMSYEARGLDENVFNCGAVACIGGHVSLIMQGVDALKGGVIKITGEQASEAVLYTNNTYGGLHRLFFPSADQVQVGVWDRISGRSAAYAIASYLTDGYPDWREALTKGGQAALARAADFDEREDCND